MTGAVVRNSFEPSLCVVPPRADARAEFGSLSDHETRVLRTWARAARHAGVDDVEDLTTRQWPRGFAGVVLGIFARGDRQATWLAVRQHRYWAVASRVDGTVSGPVPSLAEALALIYVVGGSPGCA